MMQCGDGQQAIVEVFELPLTTDDFSNVWKDRCLEMGEISGETYVKNSALQELPFNL